MSTKTLIWIFLFIGSGIGGYLPALWGASLFSYSSIIGSTIGGIAGVILGMKLGRTLNG